MKPIKHLRSKRGFYIGRLSQLGGNRVNHSKLSSELTGITGRGMVFSSFLMTLAGNEKGMKPIDPKANSHKHFHK
ncbi:hypothetical protein COL30_05270 [Bacillus pseudomycoides]|uniref:hypothetical protein n=1 Tax=Bacillus pseudomycoides TaxID=64104 RepID=UPI000BEE6106|nr:hypothetical protein [Bacillus pseudomycoides]PEA84057.1 hypothetical protein CON99_08340 [Bacillus pseudomycoides]PEK26269.1 hypothetical protein CN693_09460 [Bacillus pseudomycoides]PEO14177.1 hypothetical protein CN542_18560 [Bacillus pseudomycoides]PEP60644.1 hypothetical protein CN591_19305 [Bacillus pseudomycoides]PFW67474.1 hypothetical protein COL25_16315 [Bacillus pseudomycoides]